MADNSSPHGYDPLVQHLTDAAGGAKTYAAILNLVHNTELIIRGTLEDLIGTPAGPGGVPPAKLGLKALWSAAAEHKSSMTGALRDVCSNARVFVRTCIGSLGPVLGQRWNAQWKAAGFPDGLTVPDNPMVLLTQMRAYYTANPTSEGTVQGVDCSAAGCDATIQLIEAAQNASNQSNTDSGTAHANLLAGMKAGRDRLASLRDELSHLIGDDDDRWYAFGFDKPSDPNTPSVPENLTVVPGTPGSLMVIADWDNSRRADSYRLRAVLKIGGPDVANQITSETQLALTLAGVAAGTIVVLTVTARNDAGESLPSAPVEIAVP